MNTDPSLHDLLIRGIKRQLLGHLDPLIHGKCLMTLQSQNDIGWNQLLKGRMSKEWEVNCNAHKRRTNNVNNEINGLQWSVNIVHETWAWFLKEWLDRNKKIHGADMIAKAQKEKDRVIRKV